MPKVLTAKESAFEMQAVIRRATALTQNQWYDGWDGSAVDAGEGSVKKNAKIINLTIDQATANEDLEVRIIADNFDETPTFTCVAGTDYEIQVSTDPDATGGLKFSATIESLGRSFMLEARSLQIMYRKTTAAGANNTAIKIIYSQIP